MRIADWMKETVAYAGVRKIDGSVEIRGTGFFVAKPVPGYSISPVAPGRFYLHGMFMYFVTARHVVDRARNLGVQELAVRINLRVGGCGYIPAPLDKFVFHPDPTVDLAMIHTDDGLPNFEISPWIIPSFGSTLDAIQAHDIGVGSPVSILGLFHHHAGSGRNLPIVRTGNIAAMVEEKVQTGLGAMEALLIEARSIGGLSGSPVFANTGDKNSAFLLGIMHGHYDESAAGEMVNVGIGIVTPATKLTEMLSLDSVVQDEQRVLERQNARDLLAPRVVNGG